MKHITVIGWGKGGNVTSAGWQVTLLYKLSCAQL